MAGAAREIGLAGLLGDGRAGSGRVVARCIRHSPKNSSGHEACARALQQVSGHGDHRRRFFGGVGAAEPEIGLAIGQPDEATAAAVVDRGDEARRLGPVGRGAGLDRSGAEIGARRGR